MVRLLLRYAFLAVLAGGLHLNRDRLDFEAGIRGLTPGELARAAGISEATLSRARAGRPLQARTLAALARVLTQHKPLPNAENLVISEKKATNAESVAFGVDERASARST